MSRKKDYRPSHMAASENSNVEPKPEKPRKKSAKARRRRVHPAIWITAAVIILLIGGSYLGFSYFYSRLNVSHSDHSTETWQGEKPETDAGDDLPDEENWDYDVSDVTNILLIGVDNDNLEGLEDRGNADGLMILSVNKSTKQVVLSSLMRDVKVSVPGAGYKTKLTLVYHYEGLATLIDTIEQNFGIPIDNYVMVNYLSVVDAVDAMGGIELEVTSDELYWMEPKIINLNELLGQDADANLIDPSQAGTLTLNGIQTAAFLRIRYAGDGDFDRTGRARTVLMALANKARDLNMAELLSLANRILPQITTDLSQTRALSLLVNMPKFLSYDMVSNRIPIDDSWYFENSNIGSFVIIDLPVNREFLYRSIYEGAND